MNETIATLQSRWKSPVAWASLLIKVVGILMFAGKITVAQAELANQIIAAILFALTGVSDFNNPQNAQGY